jgi:hypothetical protein
MRQIKKTILGITLGSVFLAICLLGFHFRSDISAIFAVLYDMTPARKRLYRDVKEKIHQVELGMTKNQVKQIMGPPIYTGWSQDEGKKQEIWYFPDSRVASEPSRCTFDEKTRKVIAVISGDDYRLGKE